MIEASGLWVDTVLENMWADLKWLIQCIVNFKARLAKWGEKKEPIMITIKTFAQHSYSHNNTFGEMICSLKSIKRRLNKKIPHKL